jgi:hypothetical protein
MRCLHALSIEVIRRLCAVSSIRIENLVRSPISFMAASSAFVYEAQSGDVLGFLAACVGWTS